MVVEFWFKPLEDKNLTKGCQNKLSEIQYINISCDLHCNNMNRTYDPYRIYIVAISFY